MGRPKGRILTEEEKRKFKAKMQATKARKKQRMEEMVEDGILDGDGVDPEDGMPDFPLCQHELPSGYRCLNVIRDGKHKTLCPEHRGKKQANGTYREGHWEEQYRSEIRKLIMTASKRIPSVLVFEITLNSLKTLMKEEG